MDKIELIRQAKNAYYNTGDTIMSDIEYDRLIAEIGYESVGAPVLDSMKKITMTDKPMLSLEKCHTAEEVKSFGEGTNWLVASVKCDGLSVRIIYENGRIVSANTRGDGYIGQDITEHIKQFTNVPPIINTKERLVVDGEAIIFQHDFDEVNKNGEFKNPRNLAAGTLSCLDTALCKTRRMSFVAWDVIEGGQTLSYSKNLSNLLSYGFTVVPYLFVETTANIELKNESIMKYANEKGIPCDGVVWKFDDIEYGNSLGRTDNHFKNGIAWKPPIKEVKTKLLDIDWTMGRTGVLTPVAIFEPIDIDGSTIERASLHNVSILEETLHTPFIGQDIKVFKANLIIPQISWADDVDCPDMELQYPKICPICGGKTIIETSASGVRNMICTNVDCDGKLINKLEHFVGKKGIDVKGLSKSTIKKLIDWGWLGNIREIFSLSNFRGEWVKKPGFGEKSVDNILTAIEDSKFTTLEQFIGGIGIPLIGKAVARQICSKYDTWEKFQSAIGSKWSELEGFGPEMERAINTFDYSEANEIAKIICFNLNNESTSVSSLNNLTFCITGKVSIWKNRAELQKYIESCGGKVVGSMSSKVNYLINNDNTSTSAKNLAAQKANIPIITEEEFKEMLK